MVAVQAFVNISVVLGLMPTKGIPLPFVSSGGSSLLINLIGMGILLNVSQHASPRHDDDESRDDERARIMGEDRLRVVIAGGGTGRAPVSGDRGRARAAGAAAGRATITFAGTAQGHRGARRAARRLRARPDSQRRAEGQVDRGRAARRGAAAARPGRRVADRVARGGRTW